MDIVIKRLVPEFVDDYLHFFDTTSHSTGKAEHRCYCVCWASTQGSIEACSTASKRREIAASYIKNHYIQGYLAYADQTVIGWCNANTKADCYDCISWKMFMDEVRKDDRRIKSVFCFAIAPEFRGKGIASMLLQKVCEDAESEGFECVEAYPNINFIDDEQDYMGPVSMYERLGFKLDYTINAKNVMSKTFD